MTQPLGTPTDHPDTPQTRLRVCRVARKAELAIRSLVDVYHGLMTHWAEPSRHCSNDSRCRDCKKGKKQLWKGYFAGEAWDPSREWWLPVVFELTECSELDLRHRFGRGQVWLFSRKAEKADKPNAVTARLLDQLDVEDVPPAFNIEPVLASVYGFQRLPEHVPNPKPDRIFVEPTTGAPPLTTKAKAHPVENDKTTFKQLEAERKAKLREQTLSVAPSGKHG